MEPYAIRLPEFEGPLDLLLQLIERRELDITRVSLAALADQYLELITRPGVIELTQLADYLVIAAKLILIKSRLLLPQPETPGGEDEEDVGEALARQLREYKMFKQMAQVFRDRETKGWRTYPRRAAPPLPPPAPSGPVEGLTFEALFRALRRVLAMNANLPTGKLTEPLSVSIHHHMELIRDGILRAPRVYFSDLARVATSRVQLIVIFLAVLESIKRHFVVARQEELFGDIVLEALPETEPLAADPADLGDDWK